MCDNCEKDDSNYFKTTGTQPIFNPMNSQLCNVPYNFTIGQYREVPNIGLLESYSDNNLTGKYNNCLCFIIFPVAIPTMNYSTPNNTDNYNYPLPFTSTSLPSPSPSPSSIIIIIYTYTYTCIITPS